MKERNGLRDHLIASPRVGGSPANVSRFLCFESARDLGN